jgi:hypothetical protein
VRSHGAQALLPQYQQIFSADPKSIAPFLR